MAASYDVTYRINATGNLDIVSGQATSINKNMQQAAAAAGSIPRAAQAALGVTARGIVGSGTSVENRDYGKARGVTGLTGSSSRDFAKEAEGLGGLVRLYATFAANIFAVGAAFHALERAFNLEHLREASEVFAVETGRNLNGIAEALRKLSDGALTDKAAQKLANYGVSAGFTTDQLKRLTVAAKGAAIAQGLDVGDTVEKLITATAKMQPKVLMQIGLMTKARDSSAEYAASIGKGVDQLSSFDKRQAFINATLEEAEKKFGAVAAAIPVSPFEKFTTSLQNTLTILGNVINHVLVPILNFFISNTSILMAALGLAFIKMVGTALPALSQLGEASKKTAAEQKLNYDNLLKKAVETQGGLVLAEQHRIDELRKINAKAYTEDKAALVASKASITSYLSGIDTSNKTLKNLADGKVVSMAAFQKSMAATQIWAEKGNQTAIANLAIQKATLPYMEKIAELERKIPGYRKDANALRIKSTDLGTQAVSALPTTGMFNTIKARAELKAFSSEQVSAAVQTAPTLGMVKAFGLLGEAITAVRLKYDTLNKSSTLFASTIGNSIGRGLVTLTTAATGAFGIITSGLSTGLSYLSPWLLSIGLIVAAFQILASITGGVSKKMEELDAAQDTFGKSLENTGKQAEKFTQLQLEVDGTAQSFLNLQTYQSNMFSSMVDGLQTTTVAFREFAQDTSGWWSGMKDWVGKLFGGGVFNTQVEQLRKSIYAILATTTTEDKAKVEAAILSALPSATSINDLINKLPTLSAAQLSTTGIIAASNLAKLNIEIKSQTDNLKGSIEAWKGLGEAVKKYNEKEFTTDPKLKDIAERLHEINEKYAAATTEKAKALVLSGLEIEDEDELLKILEKRGLATKDFRDQIARARVDSAAFAAQERQDAIDRDTETRKQALSYVNAIEFQKQLINFQKELTNLNSGAGKSLAGPQSSLSATREAKDDLNKLFDKGVSAAKDNPILKAKLILIKAEMEASLETLMKDSESKANWQGRIIGEAIGIGITQAIDESIKGLAQQLPDNIRENYLLLHGKNLNVPEGSGYVPPPPDIPDKKPPPTAIEKAEAQVRKLRAETERQAPISKDLEIQIKLAQAILTLSILRASIEKEIYGYISQQTLDLEASNQEKLAQTQYNKESAEIDRQEADAKTRQQTDLIKSATAARDAAEREYGVKKDQFALELVRRSVTEANLKNEKEYFNYLRLGLEIETLIADSMATAGLVSDKNAATVKINLDYKKQELDFTKQLSELTIRSVLATTTAQKDQIKKEEQLIGFKQQQALIHKEINLAISKYKEDIASAARTEELITNSLNLQATAQEVLFSSSDRTYELTKLTSSMAITSAAKYLEITKNIISEDEKRIVFANILIEAQNKLLESKRAIYETNARDPNANLAGTIQQGMNIALADAQKKAVGLAKSIVDGVTDGISNAVDLLFSSIETGKSVSFKAIGLAFGDSLKKSILSGLASQLKVTLLGIFGVDLRSENAKVRDAILDQIKIQQEANAKIKDLIDKFDPLRNAVDLSTGQLKIQLDKTSILTDAINRLTNVMGGVADKSTSTKSGDLSDSFGDIRDFTGSFDDVSTRIKSSSELADAGLSTLGDSSTDTAKDLKTAGSSALTFAKSLSGVGGLFGILMKAVGGQSGASGGIISQLSSLFGTVGKVNGALGAIGKGLGYVGSELVGAGAAAGGLGTSFVAAGGAFDAVAVGGLEIGLESGVGSAAAAGTDALATLGAGALAAEAGLAAMVPVIGWVVAAGLLAYSFFGNKGGGPMTTGFAKTENSTAKKSDVSPSLDTTYDKILKTVADTTSDSYSKSVIALGGKLSDFAFDIFASTDPKGTAKGGVAANAYVNGKQVYSTPEALRHDSIGRTDEEMQAAISLESKRAVFAALIQTDLPENIAKYFKSVTTTAISDMTSEFIDNKIDFAGVLATINKQREQIASVFGEDLYNLVEDDLKKFSIGTEKLSDTFVRLIGVFTSTDRLIKILGIDSKIAFGALGLASTKARQNLINLAGGTEAFAEKTQYFIEHFFTETEQAGEKFSQSISLLQSGFKSLGVEMPKDMAEYRTAIHDSIVAGNNELTVSLLRLAPAFDNVIGAIERVNASLQAIIHTKVEDLKDSLLTPEQKYKKYSDLAGEDTNKLDKFSSMTDDELLTEMRAGRLTPKVIEDIGTSVLTNADKAMSSVPEADKAALTPKWITYLETFGVNVDTLTTRMSGIIAANPEVDPTKKIPEPPASGVLEISDKSLTDTKLTITEGFTEGSTIVNNSIISGLTTGAGIISEAITNSFANVGLQTTIPSSTENVGSVSNTMAATLQSISENSNRTQEATFDRQVATLSVLADKLLGAAAGMQAASAGQQNAANSFPDTLQVLVAAPPGFTVTITDPNAPTELAGKP